MDTELAAAVRRVRPTVAAGLIDPSQRSATSLEHEPCDVAVFVASAVTLDGGGDVLQEARLLTTRQKTMIGLRPQQVCPFRSRIRLRPRVDALGYQLEQRLEVELLAVRWAG